jgi:hypothetical protein
MLSPGSPLIRLLPFVGQRTGFVQQHSMIILADVKPGELEPLRKTLEQISERLPNNYDLPFSNTKTVHYAAWMVLPALRDEERNTTKSARLVLETNYDGELDAHLNDLISNCGPEFDQVYAHCSGYPPAGCVERESVLAFLKKRNQETSNKPTAYYVALPGRTIEDIRNAICVYAEARRFVHANAADKDPGIVRTELLQHFGGLPEERQPRRFPITQKGLGRLLAFNFIAGIPFMFLYGLFVWLPLTLIARCIEKQEQRQLQKGRVSDPTDVEEDFAHLNLGQQNHLCTFTTVKPGWFRMLAVRRALGLGRILTSKFFILGQLDQISTVHFLRWILIGNQILFVSNYDGNLTGYLSDFSDQAWGVNILWSNTFGFPPTRFLWLAGAYNLEKFETHALRHYSPAPVFYSAYGHYSMRNLVRRLEFRDQLEREMRK